jgi:ABC-type dipeptide/oligopeptide/nickel transport system permease component
MLGYLVRRTLFALVTGLAVLTLVFGIVRILPGKPSHVILGDFASQAAIERWTTRSIARWPCNTRSAQGHRR